MSNTALSSYQTMLSDLRAKAVRLLDDNPDADMDEDAVRKMAEDTRALIAPSKLEPVREVLAQWLLAPVSNSGESARD
jgi:hypothetical protein